MGCQSNHESLCKAREAVCCKLDYDTCGLEGPGGILAVACTSAEFPPLLSADELAAYANECLASSSDVAEDDLVVSLLSLDLHTESRETITEHLARLSDLHGCDPSRSSEVAGSSP